MITQLIEAKEEKQLLRFRKQIKQLDLIVLDELGYVPTGKVGAELLFDVLSTAYVVLDRLARTHWNAVVGDRWLSPPALVREGSTPMFNHAEIEQYQDTGYCFVRSLFAPAEIDRLRSAAKSDRELDAHALDGVLYPNLCSVFIAVDPATKENGCLQVLEGSHQL
jgi:hypothetical protein